MYYQVVDVFIEENSKFITNLESPVLVKAGLKYKALTNKQN